MSLPACHTSVLKEILSPNSDASTNSESKLFLAFPVKHDYSLLTAPSLKIWGTCHRLPGVALVLCVPILSFLLKCKSLSGWLSHFHSLHGTKYVAYPSICISMHACWLGGKRIKACQEVPCQVILEFLVFSSFWGNSLVFQNYEISYAIPINVEDFLSTAFER